MEIYKTYLRENSSTVMIEHYPLESLPQILNHANDMDFVWIDVDAIQRFQQEDVDDVLSTSLSIPLIFFLLLTPL